MGATAAEKAEQRDGLDNVCGQDADRLAKRIRCLERENGEFRLERNAVEDQVCKLVALARAALEDEELEEQAANDKERQRPETSLSPTRASDASISPAKWGQRERRWER